MTTAAKTGIGAKLRRLADSVYEDIAELQSIDGPSMSRDTHDVTTLDSQGGYREFIGGLRDGGTISVTLFYTLDGYETLKNDFESDELGDFEIQLPDDDNTTLNFSAFVTELPLTVNTEPMSFNVTFKISGETNLNSGSGSA